MSDDMNKKIKQITDILGQDKLPDNLQGILGVLANALNSDEGSNRSSEKAPQKEEQAEQNEGNEKMDFTNRAKNAMSRLGTNTDPKINLLLAIKPFLSSRRQRNVSNCIKILNLSRLTSLMDDNEP